MVMSRAASRAARSPRLIRTRGQSPDLPRSACFRSALEMDSLVSQ